MHAKETLNKLLRTRIAASRARSLLAYPFDMSRRSLCGSLHSGLLATLVQRFPKRLIAIMAMLTAVTLSVSGMSYATDLPPLTHTLTAIKSPIQAPSLRLQDMDKKIVDIKDLKGKVVVVNFWATWCPPCRREMGSLERLRLATKDKNVVILAVNIGEDIDTVLSFVGTVDPSPDFPILFDPDANSMKTWKVKGLPTTYIIHPNGTIAYQAVGGREFDHPDILQTIINLSR